MQMSWPAGDTGGSLWRKFLLQQPVRCFLTGGGRLSFLAKAKASLLFIKATISQWVFGYTYESHLSQAIWLYIA